MKQEYARRAQEAIESATSQAGFTVKADTVQELDGLHDAFLTLRCGVSKDPQGLILTVFRPVCPQTG
jgi:hypothetical protein